MDNDRKSADEIEREIEANRARLSETLDALSQKLSVDGLVSQVKTSVRRNSGDMQRAVAGTVRDHPLATALTAAGIAWLVGGQAVREKAAELRQRSMPERSDPRYPSWAAAQAGAAHPQGGAKPSGFVADSPTNYGHGGFGDSSVIEDAFGRPTHIPHQSAAETPDAGTRLAGAASAVRDTVTSAAQAVAGSLSSAAESVGDTVKNQADWLRESLSFDTEGLSEAARERVIAARQKAVEFRAYAGKSVRSGATQARTVVQEHPFVAGAAVLALGAAIAATLPRTRTEDDRFGKYSDDLVADAERIAREEVEKAKSAAKSAGANLARDAKATASEAIDAARKSARRTDPDATAASTSGVTTMAQAVGSTKAPPEAGKSSQPQPRAK